MSVKVSKINTSLAKRSASFARAGRQSEPDVATVKPQQPALSTLKTHFSVNVNGPWSTAGRESSPILRLSPFFPFELTLACSSPQTYIDCVLRDAALPFVGCRASCGGTWSLGKYDIEDCRRGFAGLNARADSGGEDSPRPLRVGETAEAGKLLSTSCSGRGAEVGDRTAGAVSGTLDEVLIMKMTVTTERAYE